MAKIILNVELKDKTASGLKDIENNIIQIGKSFSKTTPKLNTAQLEKSVNNLRKGYANLLNTIQGTEKYYKKGTFSNIAKDAEKYLNRLKRLDKTSAEYQKNVQNLQVKLGELQANFAETRKSATNFHGSLQEIVGGFIKFQAAAMVVMKPLQMVRQAWASINETLVKTEDAVISLQRVLNDDSLSDSTISGKLYDLAQRYGQTFDNVNDIAQNFARTGMSWNETIQATESALLALNVAELDATQASDGMIAIMQQFGYEASELIGIIDMLNKTADNYAVTTDKLLTALQRTGSSASNANLSLAETVGLITALSESTGRSGENLGTAINSLIQYSSKNTALDTFASLDQNTANIVDKYRKGGATILDVWMAVSGVINNMDSRQEGILAGLGNSADITDLNQELQDELGDIFETVNDVYGTANTFRKNYFIALLGNMQTVQDAIETASDASGYSQKENEKYLDTYTARVNELNAKWQELASNEKGFLGFKKGLVEIGIWGVDALDKIGGLRTASIGLGGVLLSLIPSINLKLKEIGITMNATLGWITLGATAISILVGGIDAYNQHQADLRAETLANYEANKETAKSLQELYDKYKTLSKEDEEYKVVQEDIVEILKEKYPLIKSLKEGTEEYAKAIENLTNAELNYYNTERINAANAAKTNLEKLNIGGNNWWKEFWETSYFHYSGEGFDIVSEILKNNGNIGDANTNRGQLLYQNGGTFKADTIEQNLDAYELFNVAMQALTEAYNQAIIEGDIERANAISESKGWKNFFSAISESKDTINTYFETTVDKLLNDYFLSNSVTNEADYNAMVNNIIDSIGASDYYDDIIKNLIGPLESYVEKTEELVDIGDTWEEQTASILTNYEDLLGYITEIRDREKEINDLEEKQLAVEKAKQALEDAKNNKTIYQYNAQTGGWERVVDEKAIADAEKNITNAEEAYEEALLKSMEDENLTVGEILKKVEGLPTLTTAIVEWLKNEGYDVPDNLMYGPSSTIPSVTSGMSSNVNNSSNDNRTYTVNGIPITQEQANQYTVAEILEQVANMPN